MKGYLGIDVGSVTTKMVIIDERNRVITHNYLRRSEEHTSELQSH